MRIFVIIALFQITGIGFAQVSPDSIVAEEVSKHIEEIDVMASSGFTMPVLWSGNYSLVDSLQLYSGNSYLLSEQLNKIPGVQMQQGTLSTNRITIRGIGSRTPYETNRIKAYWGDLPLTNGDGVTAIEDLGFNDIGTLSILKGPSSSLYGAGLGGVIFIDPFVYLSKNKVWFNREAGNYGTCSNLLSVNVKKNKGDFSLSLGSLKSDGYRDNSEYKRYNASLKGKINWGKSYIKLLYNFRYLNGQIPSSLNFDDFSDHPKKAGGTWGVIKGYEESSRHLLSLGIQLPLGDQNFNSFTVFGTGNELTELRPFNKLGEDRFSVGARDKLSFIGENYKLECGFEVMSEYNKVSLYEVGEVEGALISRNKYLRQYVNVFGLYEYQMRKFTFQSSINLNQTKYKITPLQESGDQYSYDLIVSPGLGLSYNLSKSSDLLASVGHGFSAPSLEESQMPDGSFNSSIKPEQGINFDIGYRYRGLNNKLVAEVTLYYMKMKDLLVTKRESEEIFYGVNAGKTRHKGMEASVGYNLIAKDLRKSATFQISYFTSSNKFERFIDNDVDYKGKNLPGIPEYNLSLGILGHLNSFSLVLDYKKSGSQYLNDGNNLSYSGFDKLSAKVAYKVNWLNLKSEIYLGADNIFDQHHASMVLINAPSFGGNKPRYYYPGLPFNVYWGIKLQL